MFIQYFFQGAAVLLFLSGIAKIIVGGKGETKSQSMFLGTLRILGAILIWNLW